MSTMTVYVRYGCRACQEFLKLLKQAPHLLKQMSIRWIDLHRDALDEAQRLRLASVPAIVVTHPDGTRQILYAGAAAQFVVNLA